jgi:hypothetical protein
VRIDATTPAFTGTITPAGAADRTYTVYPVTVEFALQAGPACGTLSRPGPERHGLRDFAWNALLWLGLVALGRRFNFRSASSPRSARG